MRVGAIGIKLGVSQMWDKKGDPFMVTLVQVSFLISQKAKQNVKSFLREIYDIIIHKSLIYQLLKPLLGNLNCFN